MQSLAGALFDIHLPSVRPGVLVFVVSPEVSVGPAPERLSHWLRSVKECVRDFHTRQLSGSQKQASEVDIMAPLKETEGQEARVTGRERGVGSLAPPSRVHPL